MDDAQVQHLVNVLTEYDVDPGHIRHNAIEFWLNDKRIVHQLDPHGDIEANLRATLQGLGVRLKQRLLSGTSESAMSSTNEVPDAIPISPEAVDEVPTTRIYNEQGTTTTPVYRSARVIAIEMERDLTIPKGHMLVIPLNRPNTLIDMPKEQFEVLFDTTEATEIPPDSVSVPIFDPPPSELRNPIPRQVRTEGTRENFENDILNYLKQRRGGVKTKVIATAIRKPMYRTEQHLRAMQRSGIVECPQTGFWAFVKSRSSVKSVDSSEVVVGKVSPQLTRILAAMALAAKASGRRDLTVREVTPHLSERDARQVGARMPVAMDKGFVERGLPIPDARGYHYCITPLGLAAVKDRGVAAYESDGMDVPEWLLHL
jgi:hypothetical protein